MPDTETLSEPTAPVRVRHDPPSLATVHLAGTDVASITMDQAVDTVLTLTRRTDHQPSLVVTPNVDHLLLLEDDEEFARAYAHADLRVADGAPLLLLARMLGTPLPERITGADLTEALLGAAQEARRSVYLLGGEP